MLLLITKYNLSPKWLQFLIFLVFYFILLKTAFLFNSSSFIECMSNDESPRSSESSSVSFDVDIDNDSSKSTPDAISGLMDRFITSVHVVETIGKSPELVPATMENLAENNISSNEIISDTKRVITIDAFNSTEGSEHKIVYEAIAAYAGDLDKASAQYEELININKDLRIHCDNLNEQIMEQDYRLQTIIEQNNTAINELLAQIASLESEKKSNFDVDSDDSL